MRKFSRLFLYSAMFFLPLLCFGIDPAAVDAPALPEQGEDRFFQEFINMLTTLGLIVGTIFLISWFLKRMVNTRIQQVNTSSLIKIVERRALSQKSSVYLVEIYDKQFFIGETMNGLSVIGEFPSDQTESSALESINKA